MSERYLFRGERFDNDEWVIGYLQVWECGCTNIFCKNEREYYEVDPATVGQCSGLSAKKSYRGTEPEDLLMFEGDVVMLHTSSKSPGACDTKVVIIYDERACGFAWQSIDKGIARNIDYVAIIGNIHDNPELLEE